MHILFLPSWYPETDGDFSGSFFREQAEALIATGHRVGVLAVRGIPVYDRGQMTRRQHGTRRATEKGIVTLRLDRVLPLPKVPGVNEGVMLRAWRDLYREYVAEHGTPDVLHAHGMFLGGVAAAALSREFGVAFIVTEHRPSSVDRLRASWNNRHAKRAAREASSLVAVAAGFVPVLNEAYGLNGGSGWQYVPGLLSPQFEDITTRSTPQGPFTIGHVSHLDPGKRVALLIDAFADAFAGDDGVRLRIAGNSVHRAALIEQAHAAGVTAQVDFVGAVPRPEIVAEFSKAHIFALPSEAEAFGTVLWEAMACGLPLVSTRTWAGRNAVTPENGLLVDIDDRAQLRDALIDLRTRFGEYDPERIREICVEHCGRAAFVEQYEALYRKAAQR